MDAKMARKVTFVVNSELLIFRKFDSLIQFHDTNRAKQSTKLCSEPKFDLETSVSLSAVWAIWLKRCLGQLTWSNFLFQSARSNH